MRGIDKLYDDFLSMERDMDLFIQKVEGLRFWERVRADIFFRIFLHEVKGQLTSTTSFTTREKIKFSLKSILNIVRNPFLSGRKAILFVGSQRRTLRENGTWWDIYTDPIIERMNHSHSSIEEHSMFNHKKPASTKNLRYFDFLISLAGMRKLLGFANVSMSRIERTLLERVQSEIRKRFRMEVAVHEIVHSMLQRRSSRLPLYMKLLKRLKPRVLVLIASYGKETLIEACKLLGITVVELQHGVISPFHPGYSFPGPGRSKMTFPDYLLVYGEYWAEHTEYPVTRDRIIEVGYPFLETQVEKHIHTPRKKQILIISQDRLGHLIAKFAVELSKVKDLGYKIVYRLHPRECDAWRERYPALVDSNVEVSEGRETSLYRLFAESEIQIGVFSTAIYEGLACGLDTYLIDLPGVEYFEPLIEKGMVYKVTSVDQFLDVLQRRPKARRFDTEYFFRRNSVNNILSFLDELLTTGT